MPNPHSKSQDTLWAHATEAGERADIGPATLSFLILCLIFLRYLEVRLAEDQKESEQSGELNEETRFEHSTDRPISMSVLLLLPEVRLGETLDIAIMRLADRYAHIKNILPISYEQLDPLKLGSILRILASIPRLEVSEFGDVQAYLIDRYVNNKRNYKYPALPPKLLLKGAIEILYPDDELTTSPTSVATAIMESVQIVAHLCKFFCPHKGQDIKKDSAPSYSKDEKMAKDEYAETIQQSGFFSANSNIIKDKRFDKILANPPFNLRGLKKDSLSGMDAFPFHIPQADNANYLFIQGIFSALNDDGRACFFMPEAASDARGSELKIRKELILTGCVDVIIAFGPIFYGTKARGTLWYLDKGKICKSRHEKVLFIDARQSKSHSSTSGLSHTEVTDLLLYAVRLYRKEVAEPARCTQTEEYFPNGNYQDINGFCKVVALAEIESNAWSLNPNRYVNVAHHEQGDPRIFKSNPGFDKTMKNEQQLVPLLSEVFEIYRDWFVDWQYPGSENDNPARSNQEELPVGWRKAKLSDVGEVISGFKVQKYDENSEQRVILSKCVRDGYINVALTRGHSTAKTSYRVLEPRLLRVGDILVNSSGVGSLGRVAQVYKSLNDFTVDSHINIVRAKYTELIDYLTLALRNLKQYFNDQAIGTTNQRRLRTDTLADTAIAIPPQDVLNQFNRRISPIRANIMNLLY